MKLFLRSILCCAVLCAFFSNAKAQQGFLVNSKNDTLKGEFKKQFIGFYKFKPEGSNKFSKINIDSTKELFVAEKSINYLAKYRPELNEPEFLLRLEKGKINLVQYYYAYGNNNYTLIWYAYKGEGPLLEIKSNQIFGTRKERKEHFFDLIGDNVLLTDQFKMNDSYSFDTIRAYIKSYNSSNK
ncbi:MULTISPECIES: hypothetical protein [unclassified Pedobacter]|uniref:hypothetical protein n=1 Tax=unclassified Pedobacter TaxID=2628915 RepID=UPI00141E8B28|nr:MULTISPECIES: hypothetical protein [unclassified Pedobacter]NII82281.1 hypothetical protein [Pedobacter sp. SG908]NMN36305.1 hypothetical protein [Pedobacter sp. SG918]